VGLDLNSAQDELLAICIRRASLDAFWSREASTVRGTANGLRTIVEKLKIVGVAEKEALPLSGPFPVSDDWGVRVAVAMLLRSLDQGQTEATVQYATTRKLRSAFSNAWQASVEGPKATVAQQATTKLYVTSCPTNSQWFGSFVKGMHRRMGDKTVPDLAVSSEAMIALMGLFEAEWVAAGSEGEREGIMFPALFAITAYLGALRGEEVPLMDLAGIRKYYSEATNHKKFPHVPVALLGRFKHDGLEKYHYLAVAVKTNSGLAIKPWVDRMLAFYEQRGIRSGRVFRNQTTGSPAKQGEYEFPILSRLVEIQERGDGVIPITDDVFEAYGVRRSFRRGATSQARVVGVPQDVIEENNRWSAAEKGKGRATSSGMLMHYTDIRLAIGIVVKFSSAL